MSTNTGNLYNLAGTQLQKGACVVIVQTEWNEVAIAALHSGCTKILQSKGVTYKTITVPGAFEISYAIKKYWDQHKYREDKPHAFIALGCVIKGDTPHFEYVCNAVTNGILQLNLSLPVPTIFGILTVNNQLQVDERLGGKHGHKGEEAAITAIKMISLF
jgi:6,7-dimethyl-8-ribityllumazine synthase